VSAHSGRNKISGNAFPILHGDVFTSGEGGVLRWPSGRDRNSARYLFIVTRGQTYSDDCFNGRHNRKRANGRDASDNDALMNAPRTRAGLENFIGASNYMCVSAA